MKNVKTLTVTEIDKANTKIAFKGDKLPKKLFSFCFIVQLKKYSTLEVFFEAKLKYLKFGVKVNV